MNWSCYGNLGRIEIDTYEWLIGFRWTPWVSAAGEFVIHFGPLALGVIIGKRRTA